LAEQSLFRLDSGAGRELPLWGSDKTLLVSPIFLQNSRLEVNSEKRYVCAMNHFRRWNVDPLAAIIHVNIVA
jgi:hypothetical protein